MFCAPGLVFDGTEGDRSSFHVLPDLTPSVPQKASPGAQKIKIGPDALYIAENVSGLAKHEKQVPTPSVPSKISHPRNNKADYG
jgi:hypothetical protein